MTSAVLWSSVALLCLAGWAATLFIVTKALVPAANALNTLQKVDALIDDRIRKVVERVQLRSGKIPQPKTIGTQSRDDDSALAAVNEIFGGASPIAPFIEQPDVEIAE